MYTFSLFKIENPSELAISQLYGIYEIADDLLVRVSHRILGPIDSFFPSYKFGKQNRYYAKFDFTVPKGESADEKTVHFVGNLFIREESGLILIDTKSELVWTEEILDVVEEHFGIRTIPLQPSLKQWISFIKEADLLSALVATPWGLEDLVESDEFDWSQLDSKPLVSASLSFKFAGPFQVRVGSGLITVYEGGNENRLEYVFQLIETYLLNGEDYIESKSPCR